MEYPRSSTCWKWVSWWRTSFSFRKSAAKLSGPCVNMYSESTNVLKVSLQLFLSKTANLTAQILFSSVNSNTTRRVCFSLTEISAFLRAARKYSSQFQSKCDQTKIFSQKSNSQHWSLSSSDTMVFIIHCPCRRTWYITEREPIVIPWKITC